MWAEDSGKSLTSLGPPLPPWFKIFRHASVSSTYPCPSVRWSVGHTFGFPISGRPKGRAALPKRMNFWKSSKRPLIPPPSFSENHVALFFRNT